MSNQSSFGLENTKNMGLDDLVKTFVPTEDFRRLLAPMNHVVLGSRGSGKTALARMLSHDHMSKFDDDETKNIVASKQFIGIYVATNVAWVGALKNKPWNGDEQALEHNFQWRFNLSVCDAFLGAAKSCFNEYVNDEIEGIIKERSFSKEVSEAWKLDSVYESISSLRDSLHSIEFKQEQSIAENRALGRPSNIAEIASTFGTGLLSPLKIAIKKLSASLLIPESCRWVICIDEAEFLDEIYQRIINTQMRAHTGTPNLIYKIITMPYKHLTMGTNSAVPLNYGDDFEYIYIDKDPVQSQRSYDFAETIFKKRARSAFHNLNENELTLENFFGTSRLIDQKHGEWSDTSEEINLLNKYATEKTLNRANRLRETSHSKFKDQISRKLHGALLLKEAKSKSVGRSVSGIYSGASLIVRCGDGNPRRLIRIFKHLIKDIDTTKLPLKDTIQEQKLREFSQGVLVQYKSEQGVGPEMHSLLQTVGDYMATRLHKEKISTDQISSIDIPKNISPEKWNLIKCATGLGLLYPNRNQHSPDILPDKEGTFHLAYVLAPHFFIMPRREGSRSLSTFLSKGINIDIPLPLFADDGLPLLIENKKK
jgi:hypothetical protein